LATKQKPAGHGYKFFVLELETSHQEKCVSYSDHLRNSTNQRPACWGNERSFDPHDVECNECRFRQSCRAQIDRGASVPINRPSYSNYANRYVKDTDADVSTFQSGAVGPDEKPVERFFKDATGGALRGMFYEMWQFWKNYRIR
jgi:hypothetical protein